MGSNQGMTSGNANVTLHSHCAVLPPHTSTPQTLMVWFDVTVSPPLQLVFASLGFNNITGAIPQAHIISLLLVCY